MLVMEQRKPDPNSAADSKAPIETVSRHRSTHNNNISLTNMSDT